MVVGVVGAKTSKITNSQKKSDNIPKIPPKFPFFDAHILKEYDPDFFILFFYGYHRINSFSANIVIALWATPLARYDLSPIRTFTYGTEEVYIPSTRPAVHSMPAMGALLFAGM